MASTYLTRTVGTATNNKKATFSFWIKRGTVTNRQMFVRIIDPSSTASYSYIEFDGTSDTLTYDDFDGSSTRITRTTNQVFRDTSAWYHIVISVDTTQATGSDRAKVYVNGSQVTSFAGTSDATQNYVLTGQTSGKTFYIGAAGDGPSLYFDGSMTHFHFIDGTAYDADTFGETDSTTGIWKPKTAPSVTYGTNGFFLKFANSGSMGTDSSGNGNNFTVGAGTLTQTQDTPANVFATFNPLSSNTGNTYSNGNTTVSYANNFSRNANSTLAFNSGKYYGEFKRTGNANLHVGIVGNTFLEDGRIITDTSSNHTYNMRGHTGCVTLISNTSDQDIFVDGSDSGSNVDFFTSTGDIVMVAFDADTKKIWFGKNGTWSSSGNPSTGANPSYTYSGTATSDFTFGVDTENGSTCPANFGNGYFGTTAVSSAQSPSDGIGLFEYEVPSGYKALCTKSINAQEYD
jgi:hypothetical protein